MKANGNFILRQVADEFLLIPVGETALRIKGMLSLSESGSLLYKRLQTECTREDLIRTLLADYDVDEETAGADVDEFLASMHRLGMLEEASLDG